MASPKENYICLDTCTLIYLANGTEPAKFLDDIVELMNNGTLTIVIPEFAVLEWNKNKDEGTIHGQINHSVKDAKKALKQLKSIIDKVQYQDKYEKYIRGEDTALKDGLNELNAKLKANHDSINQRVDNNIRSIESIIARAAIIPHNDAILIKAGKMALAKSAPVHKKNGYADAVIVLSFLDYVKSNGLPNASFVTYNTTDFCEKDQDGKQKLHTDLQPLFSEANVNFHTLLAQPLNAIDKTLVSDELLEILEEDQDDRDYCSECEGYHGFGNDIYFSEPEYIENEKGASIDDGQELPLGLAPRIKEEIPTTFQRGSCSHCSSEYIKCNCGDIFLIEPYAPEDEHHCTGCGIVYKREIETDYREGTQYEEWIILDDRKINCSNCGERFADHQSTGLCDQCESAYND